MKKQRNIAHTLLFLFVGFSAYSFFLLDTSATAPDTISEIIQFEEADEFGFKGLLRSATESQEENVRLNHIVICPFIEHYHSISVENCLVKTISCANTKRPKALLYLLGSSLLI